MLPHCFSLSLCYIPCIVPKVIHCVLANLSDEFEDTQLILTLTLTLMLMLAIKEI